MNVRRQFANAVAWMAFGNWTEQAINFAVFVILARLLGAESFGLLSMAGVFVVVSETLVRETVSEILISDRDPDKAYLDTTFWLLAALGIGLGLALYLLAGPIADLYGQEQVRALLQGLCLAVPMTALTAVPVAILRRDLKFRILSLRAIAGVFAGGVVGITMALTGFGVWSLIFQRLVQVGVNEIMAWTAVSWRPGLRIDRAAARRIGQMGFSMVWLRAGEIATLQLPLLIVGAIAGPVSAGLFYISWRLVELSSFLVSNPLRMAAQPAYAAIARQGERAADLLEDMARLTGFVALPIYGGMAILAGPFLQTLFGEKWLAAIPILAVLAPLGAYLTIERQHQAFCLSTGKVTRLTFITLAEVAAICATVALALGWGLQPAAAALILTLVAFWPLRFALVARLGGTSFAQLALPHLAPLLATAFMIVTVYLATGSLPTASPLIHLVAGSLVGVATYALIARLFLPNRLRLGFEFLSNMRGGGDTTPPETQS